MAGLHLLRMTPRTPARAWRPPRRRRRRGPGPGPGRRDPRRSCPGGCAPGEQPPQFIVVSFDGVGWHEKWQHWFDVGKQVPFRFTGFLSGTYMLSDETRMAYQGPGTQPGQLVDQLEQRGRPAGPRSRT